MFLANVSHEIRTLLGIMIGLAETISDPTTPDSMKIECAKKIEMTGKNLTRIINDILDVSKVDAGFVNIQKSKFAFSDFLNELQDMLKINAQKNNNRLIITPKGDFPSEIYSDRTRLRQVLMNLVDNSLKFTRAGDVKLTYWSSDTHLYFDVTDNGIGISDDLKKSLFQPFVKSNDLSNSDGCGLGLAICEKLAQALGGDVRLLNSQVGRGSQFLLRIKKEAAPMKDEKDLTDLTRFEEEIKGKKVLVVDDVPDSQWIVKLQLSKKGMLVDTASDGHQALDKVLENHYDVILLDMQMPTIDGYTTAKLLRERGYNQPIIALTAHAMTGERARCINAGCNDYLSKPVEAKTLYAAIAKCLREVNSVA